MVKRLKVITSRIGLDQAVIFYSLARVIQAGGGIVTVFLISLFFTTEEQGFYYTFSSVLAIQVFFELGLGGIVTQFVAHEKAFLEWSDDGALVGESKYLSRMGSVIRFCLRWYATFGLLLTLALIGVGFWFFNTYSGSTMSVEWHLPWILVGISAGLNLMISPLLAILQGLGKVKEMAKLSFAQQLIVTLSTWMLLFAGGKLFVLSFNLFISFVFLSIYYISSPHLKLIWNLQKSRGDEVISYKNEILPYQWRMALSWMSGYFIFQLFNPVVFASEGAVVAGQMGMTLAALNAVLSITLSWTGTKVPLWSSLIALKDYVQLDLSFNKVLRQSSFIASSLLIGFSLFLLFLDYYNLGLSDRFLPWWMASLLMLTVVINNVVNAWATYLRCHKQEPFLLQALVVGVLCAISTVLMAKCVGVEGVVVGYLLIVSTVSLPLSYYIYEKNRRKWHV